MYKKRQYNYVRKQHATKLALVYKYTKLGKQSDKSIPVTCITAKWLRYADNIW